MFADFDICVHSKEIAVLEFASDGTSVIKIYDPERKKQTSIVDSSFISVSPRLSSRGNQQAFCSNDGRMYVKNLSNETITPLYDRNGFEAGFCEWSKNGKKICFSIHTENPPNIYYMDLDNQNVIQLTEGDEVDRFPQWSPCGNFIAFSRMNLNLPHAPQYIFIVQIHTKEIFQLPSLFNTRHEIGRYCWSSDSSHLLVKEISEETIRLHIANVHSKAIIQTISLPDIHGGLFFPNSDKILIICEKELLVLSFPDANILEMLPLPESISIQPTLRGPAAVIDPHTNDIYLLNTDSCLYRLDLDGNVELILKKDEEYLPYYQVKEYEVVSRDGRSVPVHCLSPKNPKNLGIVLSVGGPGELIDYEDPIVLRIIKEGYEVIMPAYRGCSGYGNEHRDANRGEYGSKDVDDIIACGIAWKEKNNHKRPLAAIGYSYGGYLTFLAMARTQNPFDCGVTLWGVTRLEYLKMHVHRAYPENDIEKQVAKLKRNPLEQAARISQPLIILHGEKDTTSTVGDVQYIQNQIVKHDGTCDLVMYEDGHGLWRHREDMFERMLSFLSQM